VADPGFLKGVADGRAAKGVQQRGHILTENENEAP